jgi:hypothetical protein
MLGIRCSSRYLLRLSKKRSVNSKGKGCLPSGAPRERYEVSCKLLISKYLQAKVS